MKRGLDSYKLKLIALAFMILDHIYTYLNYPLYEQFNWPLMPEWISLITRFVSPLFLYLMIEGFYHTSSRKNYLIRLFTAAFIMMGGNVIINFIFRNNDPSQESLNLYRMTGPNNIFLTLAFLFAFIWCLENMKQKKKVILSGFLAIVITVISLILEGGLYLLPLAFIMWLFHERKALQYAGIAVYCGVLLALTLRTYYSGNIADSLYSYLCFDNEWGNIFVLLFLPIYNGERGRNTKFSKYMFYIIYPAHIWALMIIRYMIIK